MVAVFDRISARMNIASSRRARAAFGLCAFVFSLLLAAVGQSPFAQDHPTLVPEAIFNTLKKSVLYVQVIPRTKIGPTSCSQIQWPMDNDVAESATGYVIRASVSAPEQVVDDDMVPSPISDRYVVVPKHSLSSFIGYPEMWKHICAAAYSPETGEWFRIHFSRHLQADIHDATLFYIDERDAEKVAGIEPLLLRKELPQSRTEPFYFLAYEGVQNFSSSPGGKPRSMDGRATLEITPECRRSAAYACTLSLERIGAEGTSTPQAVLSGFSGAPLVDERGYAVGYVVKKTSAGPGGKFRLSKDFSAVGPDIPECAWSHMQTAPCNVKDVSKLEFPKRSTPTFVLLSVHNRDGDTQIDPRSIGRAKELEDRVERQLSYWMEAEIVRPGKASPELNLQDHFEIDVQVSFDTDDSISAQWSFRDSMGILDEHNEKEEKYPESPQILSEAVIFSLIDWADVKPKFVIYNVCYDGLGQLSELIEEIGIESEIIKKYNADDDSTGKRIQFAAKSFSTLRTAFRKSPRRLSERLKKGPNSIVRRGYDLKNMGDNELPAICLEDDWRKRIEHARDNWRNDDNTPYRWRSSHSLVIGGTLHFHGIEDVLQPFNDSPVPDKPSAVPLAIELKTIAVDLAELDKPGIDTRARTTKVAVQSSLSAVSKDAERVAEFIECNIEELVTMATATRNPFSRTPIWRCDVSSQ